MVHAATTWYQQTEVKSSYVSISTTIPTLHHLLVCYQVCWIPSVTGRDSRVIFRPFQRHI